MGELRAESRLHAPDFWLRNPDYLAYELLSQYRDGGRQEPELLDAARKVLDDGEVDVRTFPMLRYLFGADEEIDEAFSLLGAYDLARVMRRPASEQRRRDFYLMPAGRTFLDALPERVPELAWYMKRAALVAQVAGDRGGDALKQHQKQQTEYRLTRWGQRIGSIAADVAAELEQEGT
ncbi:MAG TPA: hypothetical protein VNS09_00020 [Solirubrobacter sp.]|nr:hypothetical protein [Solirubrobacter sp.]